jgi:hypothetical protein
MILSLGDSFSLLQATPADHPALSMICLGAGDAGQDVTDREDDPSLLGLIYTIQASVAP